MSNNVKSHLLKGHYKKWSLDFSLNSRFSYQPRPKIAKTFFSAILIGFDMVLAFPVSAARVWNGLPAHVTSSPSLHIYKRHLKTFRFSRSFSSAASQ